MSPVPRPVQVLVVVLTGAAVAAACGAGMHLADPQPPASALRECANRNNFVTDPARSGVKQVTPGVTVRVHPRENSHKNSIADLAKGRILARFENASSTAVPELALPADGVSCWRVTKRGPNVIAQYFSSDGQQVLTVPLSITFHPESHGSERADFDADHGPTPEDQEALDSGEALGMQARLFRPADYRPATMTVFEGFTWTTCVTNGCCESPYGDS